MLTVFIVLLAISIHAAREGGDRRATVNPAGFDISIHAAREGGDWDFFSIHTYRDNFNPRRP